VRHVRFEPRRLRRSVRFLLAALFVSATFVGVAARELPPASTKRIATMSKLPDLNQFDHATVFVVDPKLSTRTRITPETIDELAISYAADDQKPGWRELTQIIDRALDKPGAVEPFEVRTAIVFTGANRKPLRIYLRSQDSGESAPGYLDGEAYTFHGGTATALADWVARFTPPVISRPQTASAQ
jgi:hypothetical protein